MSSATHTFEWQYADYQRDTLAALEGGDNDLVVLRTGYGGGKSITGARWIHRGAIRGDPTGEGKSLVMAQDYAKGKATTYSVYFEALPGEDTNPFEDGDPEDSPLIDDYNANDKRVTYTTGHTVFLGGADKWSRFAGAEFCRIWCDEVAHYQTTDLYKLHEMLVTRQRTEVGPNTTLWTSTGNGFNQFYDIVERQVDKDDDPLRWADRIHNITASTSDNPFLAEDGLEKIKAQFEGTERAEQGLHGGFAAAEGLVYNEFRRATHVRPRAAIDVRADWRIYGYDYGWKDPRVIIEFGKTDADQYAAIDCYYEHGADVEDAIAWLRAHDKPTGAMYCDHDPEHIDKFRRAGYDAQAATKDLDEGITEVQSVLQMDDNGRPGLLVAEKLTQLIQEFQSYKEEDVGTSRAEDHCLDVTRYAIMGDRYQPRDDLRRKSGGRPSINTIQ